MKEDYKMKIDLFKKNGSSPPAEKMAIEDEILTLEEAGELLKLTKSQVYSLTRTRGQQRAQYPFPVFTIHSKAKRVRRSDLMRWVAQLAAAGRQS